MPKLFGFDTSKINIPAFVKSAEGKAFLAWLAGKNSKDIANWLIMLGQTIKGEGSLAAGTIVGKTLIKAEWLVAAACIAAGTIQKAISNGEKVFNSTDQRSGLGNILKAYWETSIPKATFDHFADFGKWLVTKPKKEQSVTNRGPIRMATGTSSQDNEKMKQIEATVSPEESGRQVVEHEINKKEYRKPLKTTSDKMVEFMKKRQTGNHPIWYGKIPEIISSNLNWGVIKQNDDRMSVAIGNKIAVALTIPHRDGVVQQAYKDRIEAIYIKMRGSNSGAFNYDSEDVAAYIECVRGIRAFLKNLQRDLKITNMSKVYVAKTPDVYLNVAGYTTPDVIAIKQNRIQYCDALNLLAATIEDRFPLPPELTVINRSDYVAEYVLTEGRGAKSSLYLYSIDRVLSPNGNDKEIVGVTTYGPSFATRLGILQTLVDNMDLYYNSAYGTKTFSKIAGDLVKAYGEKALCHYARVSINDTIEPTFDEYLLHQLQNTCSPQIDRTALSFPASAAFSNTFSMTARIPGTSTQTLPVKMVYGLIDSNNESRDVIMNTNKNNISDNEVLSLTRSVAFWKVDATTVNYDTAFNAEISDCGTDVILGMDTYYFASNGTIQRLSMLSMSNAKLAYNIGLAEMWSQMDYYPCIQLFNDGTNIGDFSMLLDIDNYAYMTRSQFKSFNDAACASLYTTVDITKQANFKFTKK